MRRQNKIFLNIKPTVTVRTKKKSPNKILISVADNGNGIPQKILDKIFQPFFTRNQRAGNGAGFILGFMIL
jgi:signal transduction histidine kinase